MTIRITSAIFTLTVIVLLSATRCSRPEQPDGRRVLDEAMPVGVPPEVMDTPWLEFRRAAEQAASTSYEVFHGFRFADRRPESGITFKHQFVDDLARDFKQTHYDHGNGVADVDGDGRLTDMFSPTMFTKFIPGLEKTKLPLQSKPLVSYLNTDGDHVLGNAFYRNEGGGRFREISDQIGAET